MRPITTAKIVPHCTPAELAALKRERDELREALAGMLDNYIELKKISLISARSDAPNWIGASLSPDDDIHVIKARAILERTKPRGIGSVKERLARGEYVPPSIK